MRPVWGSRFRAAGMVAHVARLAHASPHAVAIVNGGGHAEFDDHDAVERAGEQHRCHTDRNLKQRQTHQASERQFRRGSVGKGEIFGPHANPGTHHGFVNAIHCLTSSSACEV